MLATGDEHDLKYGTLKTFSGRNLYEKLIIVFYIAVYLKYASQDPYQGIVSNVESFIIFVTGLLMHMTFFFPPHFVIQFTDPSQVRIVSVGFVLEVERQAVQV